MKRFIVVFMVLLLLGSLIVAGQQVRTYTSTRATLSAPGYSSAIYCGGYSDLCWYFTIASINTSVTIAILAKKGDSEWTNIYANTVTYTANGNYGIEWNKVALSDSVKFRFISESGGTAAITGQFSYAKTNN